MGWFTTQACWQLPNQFWQHMPSTSPLLLPFWCLIAMSWPSDSCVEQDFHSVGSMEVRTLFTQSQKGAENSTPFLHFLTLPFFLFLFLFLFFIFFSSVLPFFCPSFLLSFLFFLLSFLLFFLFSSLLLFSSLPSFLLLLLLFSHPSSKWTLFSWDPSVSESVRWFPVCLRVIYCGFERFPSSLQHFHNWSRHLLSRLDCSSNRWAFLPTSFCLLLLLLFLLLLLLSSFFPSSFLLLSFFFPSFSWPSSLLIASRLWCDCVPCPDDQERQPQHCACQLPRR